MLDALEAKGHLLLPGLLSLDACAQALSTWVHLTRSGAGSRNMLSLAGCRALAARLLADPRVAALLPAGARAVQCTLFEKSNEQNWLVPLHQDLSLPVAARVDAAGLGGWALKEGQTFVQAPPELLAQCLALRLHLDPCGPEDGALRVLSGSHRHGRLSADAEAKLRAQGTETLCTAAVGDALLLRPLLLHASSKASGQSRRRVLHFVFGPPALPQGLRWPEYCV